jgi:hypothetical protein
MYHCIEFAAAGQDAIIVVCKLCVSYSQKSHLARTLQIGAFPRPKCSLFLADAMAIKVRPLYVELIQSSSTPAHRKSLPIARDFQSQYFDIEHWLFLDQTSWLRKESNGRSTEKSPRQPSQRYALSAVRRLNLNTVSRETTNWYGMRPRGL